MPISPLSNRLGPAASLCRTSLDSVLQRQCSIRPPSLHRMNGVLTRRSASPMDCIASDTLEWNVSLRQALGATHSVTISYVGATGGGSSALRRRTSPRSIQTSDTSFRRYQCPSDDRSGAEYRPRRFASLDVVRSTTWFFPMVGSTGGQGNVCGAWRFDLVARRRDPSTTWSRLSDRADGSFGVPLDDRGDGADMYVFPFLGGGEWQASTGELIAN
jgi:hypothetical protein